ncbi:MAG: hypothetical protein M3442_21490 [Chloroflexota bacterium]|nr:hypothetical protein [Chloroflexota bacterium]
MALTGKAVLWLRWTICRTLRGRRQTARQRRDTAGGFFRCPCRFLCDQIEQQRFRRLCAVGMSLAAVRRWE